MHRRDLIGFVCMCVCRCARLNRVERLKVRFICLLIQSDEAFYKYRGNRGVVRGCVHWGKRKRYSVSDGIPVRN